MYIKFTELITDINSFSKEKIQFGGHPSHNGINFCKKNLPISINEQEFNYMKDFIISNNLKSGFELATGVGISTLSLGLGFKETNGKLITFDSYIEENIQFITSSNDIYTESIGFYFIKDLINHYGLDDIVDIQIGASPIDTKKYLIDKNIKLDFIFLDCPKTDDDFIVDMNSILEFINMEKFVIFIHDTHTFSEKVDEYLKSTFGKTYFLKKKYFENTEHEIEKNWGIGILGENVK